MSSPKLCLTGQVPRPFAVAALFLSSFTAQALDVVELRGSEKAQWDKTPVEDVSPGRSEMVLNDLWLFQPAMGSASDSPSGQWGWGRVPGSWERGSWDSGRYEGVLALGKGGAWEGLKSDTPSRSFPVLALRGVDRAWYQREVKVPAEWAGRRIVLDLERVATDAKVFVNDKPSGSVNWPGGSVDVTAAITTGATNMIRILVIATGDGKEVLQYMDANIATRSAALLKHRGLIGDVVLSSEPAAGRIAGVFVKPSVRKKELGLDVELAGITAGGPAKLEASAINLQTGETEKTWTLEVKVPPPDAGGNAVIRGVQLPWEDPKLWDYKQPNLYTLQLALNGVGLKDVVAQRFGFREFRIVGRQFLLNERPYNFRLHGIGEPTIRSIAANQIDALLAINVNVAEIWPNPDLIRGHANTRALMAKVADEKGLPLMLGISEPTGMFDPADPDVPPETFAAWENVMERSWKQLRNSPSVVVLLVAGNRFSHADDQNPLRIGNRKNLDFDAIWKRTKAAPGNKLIESVKALDPTRPVTSHHNANVGDFQTSNNYLNLLPLQEREDWLSVWSKTGDIPFSAVEFDAPFAATMNRGRKGHTGESTSEPWLTEFLAIYQGAKAYQEEDPDYRTMISKNFVSGQDYKGLNITTSKAFHPFTAWWMTQTLRAWRGYGLSGGLIHWSDAYAWKNKPSSESNFAFPPFEPGQRGSYVRELLNREVFGRLPEVSSLTASGEALRDGYSPTMSWIAGPVGSFTRKDHIFISGENVAKSAAFLNDTAKPQPYSLEWTVEVGGAPLTNGKTNGELPVGIPTFVPIAFSVSDVQAKTAGMLRLKATIGGSPHDDAFSFTILPPSRMLALRSPVMLLDPEGTTTKWLAGMGVKTSLPPSDASPIPLPGILVLGRNAIAKTPTADWPPLRARIEAFVKGGGRVLIMSQDPEWVRANSGLRIARPAGRRFWPVPTQASHPILAGLDGEDFRDWRGAGTLVDPALSMDLNRAVPVIPRWGWHLNNTGSVASAAMEKPHFGRWTPLLEGEFDLAYSPLMEARIGDGLLVWCGLDLDGRTEEDPSAALVSRRLLSYLDGPLPAIAAQAPATYIGGPEGEKLLASLGLVFKKANAAPPQLGLLIIGEGGATPSDAELSAFVKSGGRLLLLGGAANTLGFALASKKLGGASSPPLWPEAAGLSPSDLRLRVDFEAPLLDPGSNETAANGLLGRRAEGRGVAIAFPLTPDRLPAKDKTYLRFSQWRLTRALSQILANLGGTFQSDADFFNFAPPALQAIALSGDWKVQDEILLPPAPSPDQPVADVGRDAKTTGWELPAFDDSKWKTIPLPLELGKAIPAYANKDGAFWFRRTFNVPAELANKTLLLKLGPVDDFDEVWVNGTRIGGTPKGTKDSWSINREFKIRPGMLNPGPNTIAVRCFDQFGGGGFTASSPDTMMLELATPQVRPAPYVQGFRTDHELGDDPARYYRW